MRKHGGGGEREAGEGIVIEHRKIEIAVRIVTGKQIGRAHV